MMPMRSSNFPTETRRGGFLLRNILSTTRATSAGSAPPTSSRYMTVMAFWHAAPYGSSRSTFTFFREAVKSVRKLPGSTSVT